MSTQSGAGAEFSVLPEESQQHFRLLELPAELLQVLTGPDARPLYFKSIDTSLGSTEAPNASLCTDEQTYNVRQVNTSNSVYITRPHDTGDGNEPPIAGIQAIAKGEFTYELSKAKTTPESVARHIKAILPIYSSTGTFQSKDLVTKTELFANIPFSDRECEAGWRLLACFELDDPEGCFIPSGEAKIQAWRSIVQRSHEFGADLTQPLNRNTVIDSTTDWPEALTIAVLQSLAADSQSDDGKMSLNESETVQKAGLWNLEAATQNKGSIKSVDFISEWKDLLPEKWRGKADLEHLKNQYELVNDGKNIRIVNARDGSGASKDKSGPAEAKSLGAKRKWHEKFRASKKTA